MNRSQLEHIIRAASTIADDDEIVVIGSQSVLGQYPLAPPELCVSNEADVYPKNHPERADLIDGSIGELSPFHETFGYYAQGVQEGTAVLPAGWQERLIALRTPATRGAVGLCLEMHDLLISKYVANREKDRRFNRAAFAHRLVQAATLHERLAETSIAQEHRAAIASLIAADLSAARGPSEG